MFGPGRVGVFFQCRDWTDTTRFAPDARTCEQFVAIRFTTEPVTVAGKLVLLRDDSNALYDRLLNAMQVVA